VQEGGWVKASRNEGRPAEVFCQGGTKQAGETGFRKWSWVERSVWTDRMLEALEQGVKGGADSFGLLGSLALKMPIELYSNPREVKPPTGEPDAGDPHVRFGGRGDANQCVIPTPIVISDN